MKNKKTYFPGFGFSGSSPAAHDDSQRPISRRSHPRYGLMSVMRNLLFCISLVVAVSAVSGFGADNQSSATGTGNQTSKGQSAADQSTSDDDLFSNDPITKEIPDNDSSLAKPPQVVEKKVDIGGKFVSTFTIQPTWLFDDIQSSDFTPYSNPLYLDLGMTLFLDARPDDHFRVYTKVNLYYPYNLSNSFSYALPSSENVKIKEMFSDFDINRIVFFRAGKQTIKWGVGYFFSPADIINVIPIDPQNPTDDTNREGPVAIKMQIPIQTTNLYAYVIDYDVTHPEDLALAAKGEFVVSTLETTVGLFSKKDAPPKGMLAFTYPWGDFNFFGEGVLGYGSSKTFVEASAAPGVLQTYKRTDEWLFSGTAGIQWLLPDYDFMFIAQYYFNGEGYANDSFLRDNFQKIMGLVGLNKLSASDIAYSGMHYLGVMLNWTKINKSDFGMGLFWMENFSDFSGQIKPFVSYKPNDWVSFTLNVPISFGDKFDELSRYGAGISILFQATVGGGNF